MTNEQVVRAKCRHCQWFDDEGKGLGRCQVYDATVKGSRERCVNFLDSLPVKEEKND